MVDDIVSCKYLPKDVGEKFFTLLVYNVVELHQRIFFIIQMEIRRLKVVYLSR